MKAHRLTGRALGRLLTIHPAPSARPAQPRNETFTSVQIQVYHFTSRRDEFLDLRRFYIRDLEGMGDHSRPVPQLPRELRQDHGVH